MEHSNSSTETELDSPETTTRDRPLYDDKGRRQMRRWTRNDAAVAARKETLLRRHQTALWLATSATKRKSVRKKSTASKRTGVGGRKRAKTTGGQTGGTKRPTRHERVTAANDNFASACEDVVVPPQLLEKNGAGQFNAVTCEVCGNISTTHRCMATVETGGLEM